MPPHPVALSPLPSPHEREERERSLGEGACRNYEAGTMEGRLHADKGPRHVSATRGPHYAAAVEVM